MTRIDLRALSEHLRRQDLSQRKSLGDLLSQVLPKPKLTKYIPETRTEKQEAFLCLNCFEAFYGGAAGGAKMLPLNTQIPTPKGWTELENIHPGDAIFGIDGEPHLVLDESEVCVKSGWRFHFDDGSVIDSHDKHLWR